MARRTSLGRVACALTALVVLVACSSDDSGVTDTTDVRASTPPAAAETAPADDVHEDPEPTDPSPFGEVLEVRPGGLAADVLANAVPVVVHDRGRSSVVFEAGTGRTFFAGVVDGEPRIVDLTGSFASVGGTRVQVPVALCFQSVSAVVSVGVEKYAVNVEFEDGDQHWTVLLPGGGGAIACGGGEVMVAGAGLTTRGVEWHEGRTFWEIPMELYGLPVVVGDLAYVPTPQTVLAVEPAGGEEQWRTDAPADGPIVAGATGALIPFTGEFRLYSTAGEVLSTFPRDHILADLAGETGSEVTSPELRVGGTVDAPVVAVTGTDVVMDRNGSFRHLGSATDTVRIAGVSDEHLWVVRPRSVDLVDVDGAVVASTPLAMTPADVAPAIVVASDQFVLLRTGDALTFVVRR